MKKSPIKTLAVAASLVVSLALASCGSPSAGQGTETSAGTQGKKVTLLTVAQSCDYCAKHTEEFKRIAAEAGLDLTVIVNNFNAAEQAQQVNQVISTDPDAVVVWPADATAIIPSLVRLKRADIPVVVANSYPQTKDKSLWTAYTGPNDIANGEQAALAMIEGFKEKGYGDAGNVVALLGPLGTPPSIDRLKGFEDTLAEKAPGIKVIGTQPGNWDQTTSTSASAALFTQYGGKDLKGMYSEADNMLAGALVAADRAGIDAQKMVMVGHNCSIEGYTNIGAGDQYATVLQSPIEDGSLAANTVINVLENKPVKKDNFLVPRSIDKTNLSECDAAVGK